MSVAFGKKCGKNMKNATYTHRGEVLKLIHSIGLVY